jgi:hypothetical protein
LIQYTHFIERYKNPAPSFHASMHPYFRSIDQSRKGPSTTTTTLPTRVKSNRNIRRSSPVQSNPIQSPSPSSRKRNVYGTNNSPWTSFYRETKNAHKTKLNITPSHILSLSSCFSRLFLSNTPFLSASPSNHAMPCYNTSHRSAAVVMVVVVRSRNR